MRTWIFKRKLTNIYVSNSKKLKSALSRISERIFFEALQSNYFEYTKEDGINQYLLKKRIKKM